MDYACHLLVMLGIYVILTASLNLLMGYAGQLSLAHAAFYGTGAYVLAILDTRLHVPFWLSILAAVVVTSVLGAAVAAPALRLRGDHFVIATFSFQVVWSSVVNQWDSLTGGAMGLPGISQPVLAGRIVDSPGRYAGLVWAICLVVLWIYGSVARSPFGRVLQAVREDEVLAETLGKDTARFKVVVFSLSAGLAALAGSVYASYVSFVDPTGFGLSESVFLVSAVIAGGAGGLGGPVVGSALLVLVPELLRFVGLPHGVAANMRQMVFGAFLVACVVWLPRGLTGPAAVRLRNSP